MIISYNFCNIIDNDYIFSRESYFLSLKTFDGIGFFTKHLKIFSQQMSFIQQHDLPRRLSQNLIDF